MSLYRGMPFRLFQAIFFDMYVEGGLTEVQHHCVLSRLQCDDEEGAKKHLRYWGRLREEPEKKPATKPAPKPTCEISKFVPGDHYYVLGKKFDTRSSAEFYAKAEGYEVSRYFEVEVPVEKPEPGYEAWS